MPPSSDRLPPTLAADLARLYDVIRLLGRGGMGAVWLARERSLDRMVAIKVLAGEEIESASLRERFRREARVAARLVHPNIVPLHAFGETADALYFVMGYVEGETLATRLERSGRMDRSSALRILGEISDALAFAHREGVVHRDVKPENILLDAKSGRAMLADFGVARIDGGGTSVTMTGMAVGTPSYMSPEQAVGERDLDGRSDIYSLSVVGYRMLAGRLPFTATSVQMLMAQHAAEKPDDLALVVKPGDRGIASAVMRGLAKDPAQRWARADDLRDALQAATLDTARLPEELEDIQSLGFAFAVIVLMSLVFLNGISTVVAKPFLSTELLVMETLMVGVMTILGSMRAMPAARAFGWKEAVRTMFHAPSWWSSWWPKGLRRTDDQWERLPPLIRRFRWWRDAFFSWMAVHTLLWVPNLMVHGTYSVFPLIDDVIAALAPFLGIGVIVGVARSFARARASLIAQGLGKLDATKFCSLPNTASHSAWKNPQFARMLAPAIEDARAPSAPRSPAELAQAVVELNARMRAAGILHDNECAEAAQAVRAAIEQLEGEVQRLHRELDPAELERLEGRMAALGDGVDDADLRRLLNGQRELWLQLQDRRQQKEVRRDRLHDQLRTLWMQLLELESRASRGAVVDPDLTGNVRALTRDLARTSEAMAETEQLIAPAGKRVVATPDSMV